MKTDADNKMKFRSMIVDNLNLKLKDVSHCGPADSKRRLHI